jgi:hypothetical protein
MLDTVLIINYSMVNINYSIVNTGSGLSEIKS